MRILMIHGRDQGGKDPDALKAEWCRTLADGFRAAGAVLPKDVPIDFPFYGDRLDEICARARLPGSVDVVAKGAGQDMEYERFLQSALEEMRTRAGISDGEVSTAYEGSATGQKGVQNWGWVRAIARTLDRHLTGVADFTIESFLKDVFLYVNRPGATRAIDSIVERELTEEPTIVIGHSLGSVVGYRVIRAHQRNRDIRKYITVGCPLGITAISSKLGIPENPTGQKGWYNAFDPRDIVALNPLDAECFPTDPPVINNDRIRNRTDNRHGITGYLDDANVARQVAALLI